MILITKYFCTVVVLYYIYIHYIFWCALFVLYLCYMRYIWLQFWILQTNWNLYYVGQIIWNYLILITLYEKNIEFCFSLIKLLNTFNTNCKQNDIIWQSFWIFKRTRSNLMLAKVIKITLNHIQIYAERIENISLFIYLK